MCNSFECNVHLLLQTHSQYSNFEFAPYSLSYSLSPFFPSSPSFCPSPHPLPLSPTFLSCSPSTPTPSPPFLSPLPYLYFTARIRFEEIVYSTSELDDSVDVCVAVTNGIMDFDLPVNIEVLPMSTAVGKHFKYILVQYIQCTCRYGYDKYVHT